MYHQSASAPEYIEIYWTSWHIIMRTLTTEHEPGDTGGAATPISTECITSLPVLRNTLRFIGQKKVQVGKDQEKAQSEKDSHSKNRGGKKPN